DGMSGALNGRVQGHGASCTATVTSTPAANYFGLDGFSFTASDGQATSASAAVSITVIQFNQPPTANAGGPYTGSVGVPVQFNGSGRGPGGNPVTLEWAFGGCGTGNGPRPDQT